MPMYEYKCQACGHAFERYAAGRGKEEDGGSCPRCGKGKLEKLFSTFSAASCCGTGVAASGSGGCGGGSGSFS